MKHLILIIFLLLSVVKLSAQTDDTLCDTGIKIEQRIQSGEGGNVLLVVNPQSEQIFIVAIDYGADGFYEILVFDTDGDGNVDMQLEGGQATAEQVLWLYCGYQRIELSMVHSVGK